MTEEGVQVGANFGSDPNLGDSDKVPKAEDHTSGPESPVSVREAKLLDGENSEPDLNMDSRKLSRAHSDQDWDAKSMPPPERPRQVRTPVKWPHGKMILPMNHFEWTLSLNEVSAGRVRSDGRILGSEGGSVWMIPELLKLNKWNQPQQLPSVDIDAIQEHMDAKALQMVPEAWWNN